MRVFLLYEANRDSPIAEKFGSTMRPRPRAVRISAVAVASWGAYTSNMTGAFSSDHHWRAMRGVGFHEAGPDGRLRLDVLADWLQDVGAEHAAGLGLSTDVVLAKGVTWMLRRLTLQVHAMPSMGEDVDVETWPAGRDRMYFHRDFRLTGAESALLVAGNARWGIFDVQTHRASAVPDWMADKVLIDPTRAADFSTGPVPPLGDAAAVGRAVPPRWSDLDLNGHVNNARLVGWVLEALPRDVVASRRLVSVDVAFRMECRLDDSVMSRAAIVGDGVYRHALVNTDSGKDIARAETVWRT